MECEPVDDLGPVWRAIPAAARLQYQDKLRPILANLKILDLIALHLIAGGTVQTSTWVGESSIAIWFWDTWVAVGDDRRSRERLTMLIAERLADELRPAIPLDTFSVPELVPLNGLERDLVFCGTDEEKVIFAHDLYGDWARLRILIAAINDLVEFLRAHLDSPLWHRAIRLYGVYLLEHMGDIEKWRTLLTALSGEVEGGTGDLLSSPSSM